MGNLSILLIINNFVSLSFQHLNQQLAAARSARYFHLLPRIQLSLCCCGISQQPPEFLPEFVKRFTATRGAD